ncbi:MAG: response regulator transcription factor [Chloroflexi bacterium]|nr:MAG: response regulator transcription factor [Chloroflexota bacterium]
MPTTSAGARAGSGAAARCTWRAPPACGGSRFLDRSRARQVPPIGDLTRREEEVLQLVCLGLRNSDVAQRLHVAESTVEFHMSRVLAKLGVRNRVEAVDRALALGLA